MTEVLTLVGYYLPGNKSGGPGRTVSNLVDRLGDEFIFRILTRDRDLGDDAPYPHVAVGTWQQVRKAQVYYLPLTWLHLRRIRQLAQETPHDVVYLNGAFNAVFTLSYLLLRRFGSVPDRPVILTPQGEFSTGALRLKAIKKRAFLVLARMLGLYRDVLWHASSEPEAMDIQSFIGAHASVAVVQDLPPPADASAGVMASREPKTPGVLRAVHLARVAPMKNLRGALEILSQVKGTVILDVYGPIEDERYWLECLRQVQQLPANIRVQYRGVLAHEEVVPTLARYDLYFLPTLGESYCQAIVEAMSAGCPVLISDQTPWRYLEDVSVGWDVPLGWRDRYVEVLERCVAMTDDEHRPWTLAAHEFATALAGDPAAVEQHRRLFADVDEHLRSPRPTPSLT